MLMSTITMMVADFRSPDLNATLHTLSLQPGMIVVQQSFPNIISSRLQQER
jgi:hypothetical protein